MASPVYSAMELPLLRVLNELGGAGRPGDPQLYDMMASYFSEMTPEERQETRLSTGANRFANRVQWVRLILRDKGQIDPSVRGVWSITDAGRERLQREWPSWRPEYSDRVDNQPRRHVGKERQTHLNDVVNANKLEILQEDLSPEVSIPPNSEGYVEPSFEQITLIIHNTGMHISNILIRRYHLALKTNGFVILSGMSGTGKTWLTEAYASAVGAKYCLVPVAPNWNSNEDLLGYYNPLDKEYHDTAFSLFLREAATEYRNAEEDGSEPRPYHLVLDEMNLARIEYYFAKFLSAMEQRRREDFPEIELSPQDRPLLPPNLYFIGTVNVDETTHGFSDKVYDRAQLIELDAHRDEILAHISGAPYRDDVMRMWDAVQNVAPFSFRVLDEFKSYITAAAKLEISWEDALDEQFLQKVLPKLKGTAPGIGEVLEQVIAITVEAFPLTHAKAAKMLEGYRQHGFASYF